MALWDNLMNAMRPYDDEYMENEASEEETVSFNEPPAAPPEEDYFEAKPKAVFSRREAKSAPAPSYTPAPAPEKARTRLILMNPSDFGEAAEIADNLKERRAVLMNVEQTDNETARRLIDFLSGVVYALGGKIVRISAQAYVLTPTNIDLVGDGVPDLESAGIYF